MREVAAEQRVRPLYRAVAELEKREPPVAGLLTDQAERVVLAEELLRRVVRDTSKPVHDDDAAQPAGAPKSADRVVGVDTDTLHLVLHRGLVGECVGDERRVGPQHELVVIVGMGAVELRRQRDEVELWICREPLADARRPAGVGPGSVRLTVRNRRSARRQTDDRIAAV